METIEIEIETETSNSPSRYNAIKENLVNEVISTVVLVTVVAVGKLLFKSYKTRRDAKKTSKTIEATATEA